MPSPKTRLDALVTEVWEALIAREPLAALGAGRTVVRLKRDDLAEAEAAAAAARDRRDRLDAIDLSGLDRIDRLTASYLRAMLDLAAEEPQRWLGGFGVTPYHVSAIGMVPRRLFPAIDLADAGGAARYLDFAGQYVASIEALHERLAFQAERGWRLPKPALPNVRRAVEGLAAMSAAAVAVAEGRPGGDAIRHQVGALIEEQLKPAFARLLAAIGADYEALAPDAVGLAHQPGGVDAYRAAIRYQLGYDADPAEIHRIGLDEVARLAAEMARVRREQFGHEDDEASFHERLRHDPKAKTPTAEALEATYHRHLASMAPVFARLFRRAPQATPAVKRLPPELEAGMTFGYYSPPREPGGAGIYFFSGNGIPDRLQMNAAALIFHELVPGHHVQVTRQQENEALPEFRRTMHVSTTFSEGWAEYASGLADEAGLLDDPYDRYGFLAHQRFVAQRLVVDTGLNALGWTLDRAHAYMSANTLERPEQVTSELLRYATDMPAQSLCYRLGFLKFRELRAKAEATLGPKFDVADFHEAILDQGCLPIPVLEQSLDEWAAERSAG